MLLLGYRAINRSWFSYAKAKQALAASAPDSSAEVAVAGLSDLSQGDFIGGLRILILVLSPIRSETRIFGRSRILGFL